MSHGSPRVGVLALQGDFAAHVRAVRRVGAEPVEVRTDADLRGLAALIMPGGESTTISRAMTRLGLFEPVRRLVAAGAPILGTCAGAILLARRVLNHPVRTLELLDATAVRNAYGTQVDSFGAVADPGTDPGFAGMCCVFIRAPQLCELGPDVDVLLEVDGAPVLVRQGRIMATTFHPELTDDTRVHQALLALIDRAAGDTGMSSGAAQA
jgi:5'-phosphate synthase pdxT subunit